MKAVVATFNQEKALVGAFSVIVKLPPVCFGNLRLKLSPAVSLHYLTHLATFVHRSPVHLDPKYFPRPRLELCVLASQYLMKVPSEMPIMSPVTN